MRLLCTLLVLACACLSSGCYVANLSGIADASNSVLDEILVGRWQNTEDEVEVVVARDEWQSYAVTWRDRSNEQQFTGRLTAIGGRRFIDLTPRSGTDAGPVLLPVHVTCRLTVTDGALVVEVMNYEWFTRRLGRRQLVGLTAVIDDRGTVLVTSTTAQWRKWLLAHATSTEVFEEAWTLTRIPEVSK